MSPLAASLVLLTLCVLARYLVPWLVQSNSTLALLWHDFLLEAALNFLTRSTRPQVTVDLLSARLSQSLRTACLPVHMFFSMGGVLVFVCSQSLTDQSHFSRLGRCSGRQDVCKAGVFVPDEPHSFFLEAKCSTDSTAVDRLTV